MAPLTSLQGTGGGRIPMGRFSYDVSRTQLTEIINAMPPDTSHALRNAARTGDTATAQRLIREAAATYFASAPAVPAACPPAPRRHRHHVDNSRPNQV